MEKAIAMLEKFTTEQLIEQFELTTDNTDENIPTVRGWLMTVIEKRNPEAFDKWIDDFREDSELRNYIL